MRALLFLPVVLSLLFVMTGCDRGGGFGGAALSARIKIEDRDEATVLASLGEWLTERGYQKSAEGWKGVTGGKRLNLTGQGEPSRHLESEMYVLWFEEGAGHHAWGIVPASDEDRFVRVFHHTAARTKRSDRMEELRERVSDEHRAFHAFVDEAFPDW